MKSDLIRALSFMLMLVAAFSPTSAAFLPIVTNYQAPDYKAELQNWDATQLPGGRMCFANTTGILFFDGHTWERASALRDQIVRSVFYDSQRLYVGSYEEFGYFSPDASGHLVYKSLSSAIKKGVMSDDEFWTILRLGGEIWFQSFDKVFRHNPATGKTAMLPMRRYGRTIRPQYMMTDGSSIIIQNIEGGMFRYAGGGWQPIASASEMQGKAVGMAGGLIATDAGHIYRCRMQEGRLNPVELPTDLPSGLRINRIVSAPNGMVALGTIGSGVFLMDLNGKCLWHISREEGGLCNNSVLGMTVDASGNIWATLDDGIALIHTSAPYTVNYPAAGKSDIGMVYDIGKSASGTLIAAANQGAYFCRDGEFTMLPSSQGHNWCVRSFGGQTFVGGNDYTIEIPAAGGTTVHTGACTDMKQAVVNGRDVLLQSTYYDLRVFLRDQSGRWRYANTPEGFGAPVLQLEVDADGSIWASHLTQGLYRMRLSSDFKRVEEKKFFPSLKGGKAAKLYVMKIRGKVVFSDDSCLYIYNEEKQRFEEFTSFTRQLPYLSCGRSATRVNDRDFWLSTTDGYHLVRYSDGRYQDLVCIPLSNFPRQINGANCRVFIDADGTAYFNLNGGIGRVEKVEKPPRTAFSPLLAVVRAESIGNEQEVISLSLLGDCSDNEARFGNIRVVFSYPNFDHEHLRYRFRLRGKGEELVKVQDSPEIIYPDLGYASYTLTCEVVDVNGKVVQTLDYRFSVPRPWWLSAWMIVLYILLAGAGVWLVARWYARRRLDEERRLNALEKKRHEEELQRKELVIAMQQNKLLERQLTEKGKELASMAIGAYSRQMAVEQLKASLADAGGKGSTATIRNIGRKLQELSEHGGNSDEFWSVFESNFDLIHDHFFRNLRERCPALTAADLKLCALLRLNLTTKDIARFQGMTIRGVETARYRLRKKLGLGSEESLTDYLIDLQTATEPATSQQ